MPNAPWVICRWHITEEEIKAAFVKAFNKLVTERAGANVASRSCARTSASCASVAEFYERLWGAVVDYVTVGVDGGMTVVFRDGTMYPIEW